MSDQRELYQQLILDHGKRPRNKRHPEVFNRIADGHNPLCGDKLRVYADVEDGVVRDLAFEGAGCAISTASASMMTEAVKGLKIEEAESLFNDFHHLLTVGESGGVEGPDLGKLAVFGGVREFPVRVKCATLPWHTLHAALANIPDPVSTEE